MPTNIPCPPEPIVEKAPKYIFSYCDSYSYCTTLISTTYGTTAKKKDAIINYFQKLAEKIKMDIYIEGGGLNLSDYGALLKKRNKEKESITIFLQSCAEKFIQDINHRNPRIVEQVGSLDIPPLLGKYKIRFFSTFAQTLIAPSSSNMVDNVIECNNNILAEYTEKYNSVFSLLHMYDYSTFLAEHNIYEAIDSFIAYITYLIDKVCQFQKKNLSDVISKHYETYAMSSYRQSIIQNFTSGNNNIEAYETKLLEAEAFIDEQRDKLRFHMTQEAFLLNNFQILSGEELEKKAQEEMKAIGNNPNLISCDFTDCQTFTVKTKPVIGTAIDHVKKKKYYYNLGSYFIQIHYFDDILPKIKRVPDGITVRKEHPHANNSSPNSFVNMCWGNMKENINHLMQTRQFNEMIDFIYMYLGCINTDDTYGRTIWDWPVSLIISTVDIEKVNGEYREIPSSKTGPITEPEVSENW